MGKSTDNKKGLFSKIFVGRQTETDNQPYAENNKVYKNTYEDNKEDKTYILDDEEECTNSDVYVAIVSRRTGVEEKICTFPASLSRGQVAGNSIFNCPSVSRSQAHLVYRNNVFYIVDGGSKGGTWINGSQLQPGGAAIIRQGDVMRFGREEYIVFDVNTK